MKRPLMPVQLGPEQVGLEMLCLCGQLDLLIRAQMQQVLWRVTRASRHHSFHPPPTLLFFFAINFHSTVIKTDVSKSHKCITIS